MHRIVLFTFVVILGLICGCSKTGPKVAQHDVLDVAPANIPSAEPTLASAPINDTPVFAAPAPQVASQQASANAVAYSAPIAPIASPAAATGARTYKVQKGDTLFSIAKTQLGNGRDWQKIVAANPGLTPAKLKAGQQIAMP